MDRGFVSLGSGLFYLQRKLDVSANNLANSGTYGFKKDTVIGRSFNAILSDALEKHYNPPEKRWNSGKLLFKPGVYVMQTVTDYNQGRIEETGKYNDLALQGDGFLAYENENGIFYGRGDTLDTDREGYLIARGKGRVLGQTGAIRTGGGEYTIDRNGNVTVNGNFAGKLRIVDFMNKEALEKMGNQMVSNAAGDANIINDPEVLFVQGSLEASNTDLVEETVAITDILRKYEAIQRSLQMTDQIAGLAANELGKV